LADREGADFFGIADLAAAHEAILAQGGDYIARYPRAVSIGIRLMDSIIDTLPRQEERMFAVHFRHHAYDVINQRLDRIASRLASRLQKEGYDALPLPASKRVDDARICAAFSHKLAAHLAGLGWIGKNCLLVTPEVGPRARWVTVLTAAPFAATGRPLPDKCGKCVECVKICPVEAFTGRNFIETEARESRFDARKCEQYLNQRDREFWGAGCGLCMYACPRGRKRSRDSGSQGESG
jgi:epoxyqueuosine reductase